MVQDESAQIGWKVVFTGLRLIDDVLVATVEATAGLYKDLLEPDRGPGRSDTFMAQKVPSGCDKSRVVAKLETVQDVEHQLGGKLINGESVEPLELQTRLKALLNRPSCCVVLPLERRMGHFALRQSLRSDTDLEKRIRRGTRQARLE